MADYEIKTLSELDSDRFRELAAGYTSREKYAVSKTETDGQTTITLEHQALAQPYVKFWTPDQDTESHYQEILSQGLSLGLYNGTKLIGIAIAEKRAWNRSLWVWEFHLDPQYREQGLGRKLMDTLAERGQQAGCRVMVCETQNTNVPAIRFYRKVGFEVGGIDLSYYTNQDVDEYEVAIFMKRYLPPKKGA